MSSFVKASKITLAALVIQSSVSVAAFADSTVSAVADSRQPLSHQSLSHQPLSSDQPLPEYPRRAELSGIEGYTVVEFVVLPDGTVADTSIKQSSNRLFSQAAINTVQNWEFESRADVADAGPVTRTIKFNFTGL